MDLIAVDLTGGDAAAGDWVELWGEQVPVCEVAEKSGTIAYELLARVAKLHHEYSGPQGTSPDSPSPG